MDTNSILYELESLDKELVRLRKKSKELGDRKKQLVNQVIENLQESGENSVTHKGVTYILDEQSRYSRKGEKQKREDALTTLAEEGIHGEEAVEIYEKLSGAMRGPEKTIVRLKK